jgi:hypothetical protein
MGASNQMGPSAMAPLGSVNPIVPMGSINQQSTSTMPSQLSTGSSMAPVSPISPGQPPTMQKMNDELALEM